MTKLDGLKSKHCIITPTCRKNRGDIGAFDEAVRRIEDAYKQYVSMPGNVDAEWHIVLLRCAPSPPGANPHEVTLDIPPRVA